jgi:2,3-dihydroxyethylbenzene 1,2-dioxygenase
MVKVTELGYMGFNVTDMAAWESFATEIVGMELHDAGEGDRKYLRLDDWHHRFVLHQSNEDDMAYIGWRVPGPDELEERCRTAGPAAPSATSAACWGC